MYTLISLNITISIILHIKTLNKVYCCAPIHSYNILEVEKNILRHKCSYIILNIDVKTYTYVSINTLTTCLKLDYTS